MIIEGDDNLNKEFYSYAMINKKTSYSNIKCYYNTTHCFSFQGVHLDAGRIFLPVPKWGEIHSRKKGGKYKFEYKYFMRDSFEYKLLLFFYNSGNHEQEFAMNRLKDIFRKKLISFCDKRNKLEV